MHRGARLGRRDGHTFAVIHPELTDRLRAERAAPRSSPGVPARQRDAASAELVHVTLQLPSARAAAGRRQLRMLEGMLTDEAREGFSKADLAPHATFLKPAPRSPSAVPRGLRGGLPSAREFPKIAARPRSSGVMGTSSLARSDAGDTATFQAPLAENMRESATGSAGGSAGVNALLTRFLAGARRR